jgi:glycosyltransferase involved in cell wall biosynthesis
MTITALIPAYEPDKRLLQVVRDLRVTGRFADIVVINDGSSADKLQLFNLLSAMPGVTVLHHPANHGKGSALKTGFQYLLQNLPECSGTVTVDADGQHLAADAVAIADELTAHPKCLIIGARQFDGEIPWRSKIGNTLTRYAFKALMGANLTDTQSGLRGIPRTLAADLLELRSSGYEFELDMLVQCRKSGIAIRERTIATIYLDGNRQSHFNPWRDSLKIYFVLLRFVFASLVTAATDYAVFIVLYFLLHNVLLGIAVARASAIGINFLLVREVVFHSRDRSSTKAVKFVLLVIVMGGVSYTMIQSLMLGLGWSAVFAKVFSELLLYPVNFKIQREWIFKAVPIEEALEPLAEIPVQRAA